MISMNKNFRGAGVALITPFNEDLTIDFEGLGRVVDTQLENHIDYLVVLGTTAETATLNNNEKQQIVDFVCKRVNGKIPIVVGIGGNNTQEVINCIRQSDLKCVDAILSVAPYYNKPTQKGLFQHFKAIATCSPVPVILYNVPGRTGSNISSDTCLELAHECENIIGVKEASGDISQIMRIIKGKPENFALISGDDMMTIPIIALGGLGVISVLANAFPTQCNEIVSFSMKGNFKSAREMQFKMLEILDLLFIEGNPSGVKAMLNVMNICQNSLRLPLVPVNRTTYTRIQKAIEEVNKS